MSVRELPAVYMRGGLARGVVLHARDLPRSHAERDVLLARMMGSPDPFGLQTDGMGAGVKVAVVSASRHDDCDVDCLIGTVRAEASGVDWTAACTELPAAVALFALSERLLPPTEGLTRVRIRQEVVGARIDAHVQVRGGRAVEAGGFFEDGVPFASAEVRLEFLGPFDAVGGAAGLLPTGNPRDPLEVPGVGRLEVTLLGASVPVAFVRADALSLSGRDALAPKGRRVLARLEAVRAAATAKLAAIGAVPVAPSVCCVSRALAYRLATGGEVGADRVDLIVGFLGPDGMPRGFDSDDAIAVAAASALPGSVPAELARTLPGLATRIGHARGTLPVGAQLSARGAGWQLDRVVMSRGARRLMTGLVHVPTARDCGAD